MRCRLPEFRGRTAVSLAEQSAELAVAGEAEVETEAGEVIILREKIQRPRQAVTATGSDTRVGYAFHLFVRPG